MFIGALRLYFCLIYHQVERVLYVLKTAQLFVVSRYSVNMFYLLDLLAALSTKLNVHTHS